MPQLRANATRLPSRRPPPRPPRSTRTTQHMHRICTHPTAFILFLGDARGLLLCRRHKPASSATHAELHRRRRHTPDVGTRHRLRLRRHTPTSLAPATRRRAHHARQDRHTIHCRSVTIGDYAQADTRPGNLALPLPARSLPLHRTTTAITLPAVASVPPARGVPLTTN